MRTVNHLLIHYREGKEKPLCEVSGMPALNDAPDLKIRCPKCRRRCA
jgi:hypothetical protein